jgi:HEPN domain-containing protein
MSEVDIANEWLQIAYSDYDSAKFLYDYKVPKPVEIICYHCQQSAEKSLKAFICANDIDIPKTHEVKRICAQCAEIDESFTALFDDCEELEVYATETRYPIRIEIDSTHAERALKQAIRIYEFTSDRTNQLFKKKKATE